MTTDSPRVYKLIKRHIKDILKRLNALEEAEKARLDAEHEELQQDEYDDDDYEDDDPEDDDDDEPSGECEHCQGTGFAKDDNNNDDDDDESDKHCPSCTCNEPDK